MFEKALPIWAKEKNVNQYLNFYQKFKIEKTEDLTLKIRCHSNYAVWINGQLVAFGQYPDYEHYKIADIVEIPSNIIKMGENIIAVLAYCQYESSSTYAIATPSLIFEVVGSDGVAVSSGTDTFVRNECGYLSGEIEKITPQLGFTFHYDSTMQDDWITSDKPEGFVSANQVYSDMNYIKRPIKKTVLKERCPATVIAIGDFICNNKQLTAAQRIYNSFIKPQQLPKSELGSKSVIFTSCDSDGIFIVIDLQKERAGYLDFDIETYGECLIDIGYGEHLNDLRVRAYTDDYIRNFACSYKAKPGVNIFTDYFLRIAGRYLQIHFYTPKIKLNYIGIRECVYPLNINNPPKGLDSLEKQIYNTCVDTLRLCMHDHYEDCPWREQALYAMDSRIQMLLGYIAFGEYEFAKASITLLGKSQRNDGLLNLCAPSSEDITIPSFSLVWIVSLKEYVFESGDVIFGKEWLPTAKSILEVFENNSRDGLVLLFNDKEKNYWNFYEWSQGLDGYPDKSDVTDSLINLFFAYALKEYTALAEYLGMDAEKNKRQVQFDALKKKINSKFFCKDNGAYFINAQNLVFPELAQALAVISDVAVNRELLIGNLAAGIFKPNATLNSKIFTYQALTSKKELLTPIRNEIKDIWGKMLFSGATSFWEVIEGADAFNGAASLCHGWSAVPIYVYNKIIN